MSFIEESAREEEALFAQVRAVSTRSFYTVSRPSRSGGHAHIIHLDALSHTPIDVEHPCSCAAGADGRWCWAVLEVLVEQAPGTQSAELAAEILAERARKSVKHERKGKP